MTRSSIPMLAALIAVSVVALARGQEPGTAPSAGASNADEQAVRRVTQDFVRR